MRLYTVSSDLIMQLRYYTFNNGKRNKVEELVEDKNAIVNVTNISNNANNCLLFKNTIEYEQARFIQVNKMIKKLIIIFFSNSTLVSMWKHLSYKNIDKIRALLTKLSYNKVT